jgi:hypothetical protein
VPQRSYTSIDAPIASSFKENFSNFKLFSLELAILNGEGIIMV